MKIVIAGAGAVGFHLAELLSKENQDITIIDLDEDILANASRHLDVLTIKGDASSIHILKEAGVNKTELFLAVTTSQNTNLLLAILAKQFGARKTIARVNNPEYLDIKQKERFHQLGVDTLISPEFLATQEIERLLNKAAFTDIYNFEDDKLSVVGMRINQADKFENKSIAQIGRMFQEKHIDVRAIALLRDHDTIIPKGTTETRSGDHIYFSTNSSNLDAFDRACEQVIRPIKNVLLIGSSDLALHTAKSLESIYNTTLVIKDKERAKTYAEELNDCLVLVGDPNDIDLLKEEGLAQMDAFIALTENSETNIIASLTAEKLGVNKTIALVDNVNYTHLSQNIGIDTIINQKLIAANNIFRFVRKGQIEAIASLHGVDAEVIEFIIHKNGPITKKPIRELLVSDQSIVAGVIRGDETIIPGGDFVFNIHDKVVVFALPEAIKQVEKIFK